MSQLFSLISIKLLKLYNFTYQQSNAFTGLRIVSLPFLNYPQLYIQWMQCHLVYCIRLLIMCSKQPKQFQKGFPKFTNELRVSLFNWKSKHYNKPVMRWEEFSQLCETNIPSLRIQSHYDDPTKVEERRRAIAYSLHKVGEIIYFEELDFITVDCEWFFEEVLGHLVRLNNKSESTLNRQQRGFTTRKELEFILR